MVEKQLREQSSPAIELDEFLHDGPVIPKSLPINTSKITSPHKSNNLKTPKDINTKTKTEISTKIESGVKSSSANLTEA